MSRDTAWFLERLADPAWLCRLDSDPGRTVMDSSLNRRHGPRDCNHFLREEADGWKVLVDYQGAGCLTRFWTAGDFDGELEISLDGGAGPLLRTTLRSFFGGGLAPFVKPLVLDCPDSSQGRVSYFPVPFATGCRVRARSDTGSFYWQINALRFDDGDVATFEPALDEAGLAALARIARRWGTDSGFAPGGDALPAAGVQVPARGAAELACWDGPGRIDGLSFRATDPSMLQRLWLRIDWDGAETSAVEAPLAQLACQGSKARDFSSLFARRRGDEVAVAWPMPFAAGARLRLVNPSTAAAAVVWRAWRSDGTAAAATPLRFHCRQQSQVLPYGTIFQLLSVPAGRGRWLGLSQVSRQLGPARIGCFHQEGNEYVYVDGEPDPSWLGTGTEDYFNCAYFYRLGEVATPTHGCLDQTYGPDGSGGPGLVSAYRWHLLDSVAFERSLIVLQEAGCPRKGALAGINGGETLHYEWLCPHYLEGPQNGQRKNRSPDAHPALTI